MKMDSLEVNSLSNIDYGSWQCICVETSLEYRSASWLCDEDVESTQDLSVKRGRRSETSRKRRGGR